MKGSRQMWNARFVAWPLWIMLVVLNVGIAAAQSEIPDTEDNRLALAVDLAEITLPIMVRDVEEATVSQLPEGSDHEMYRQMIREAVTVERVKEVLVPALISHFSAGEIKALSDFYASPVGNSILRKYGAYTSEIQPAISEMVMDAVRSVRESLENPDE